ncbi:hypothetical protein DJ66_0668 [Candidatus Liberibacter solanacearum]|uniref:Uncharacterized protein n=1 Tax=Candidatus Liberibacter solanacearum TaxID=556287 RepID=A0A0F4VK94_9HYPH|nr:hypothetical protein DJ66_0668 [Candidatus Liberibacter solanacearum]
MNQNIANEVLLFETQKKETMRHHPIPLFTGMFKRYSL